MLHCAAWAVQGACSNATLCSRRCTRRLQQCCTVQQALYKALAAMLHCALRAVQGACSNSTLCITSGTRRLQQCYTVHYGRYKAPTAILHCASRAVQGACSNATLCITGGATEATIARRLSFPPLNRNSRGTNLPRVNANLAKLQGPINWRNSAEMELNSIEWHTQYASFVCVLDTTKGSSKYVIWQFPWFAIGIIDAKLHHAKN